MTRAVALLRAVNVAGRRSLPMAELARLAAGAGLGDARTYLASGNLVFTAEDPWSAAADLEAAIARELGLETRVIVRTREELAAVAVGSPLSVADPKLLHVVFLAARPSDEGVTSLDPDRSPPDVFEVVGEHVYVSYPNGSGRSKLSLDYFERTLGVAATARNWNTVTSLLELLA